MTKDSNAELHKAKLRNQIRGHLNAILAAYGRLQATAEDNSYQGEHRNGPPLGGEPMVHLAHTAPWSNDALAGEEEPTPEVELIWWEYAIRQTLNQPTDLAPTVWRAVAYIDTHLSEVHEAGRINLDKLATRTASMRRRLEDTVHAGLRDEYGVPCLECGHYLIRRCHPKTGLEDSWACAQCRRTITPPEYWQAVREAYRRHAPALTANDLADKLGIRPNLIRQWGAKGHITKRGRNIHGQTLYDVQQATQRATGETTPHD